MKKNIFLTIIILFSLLIIGCTSDSTQIKSEIKEPKKVETYEQILKRVKAQEKDVDFGEFRMAYVKTDYYNPYEQNIKIRKEMSLAISNKDYKKALELAGKILEKNYVDIEAHMVCLVVYEDIKKKNKYEYHAYVLNGLIGSILKSGSGKSPESAFVVISIREETIILEILGYKQLKQRLISKGKHKYDAIEVEKAKTKKKTTIYFNVDIPLGNI
ncbi:DUF4919 domain-containing protein [Candidatus Dependentiae bacterium]|nr:DUF4919 domain-containing protein [Candidatus Dependentiae bacterium]